VDLEGVFLRVVVRGGEHHGRPTCDDDQVDVPGGRGDDVQHSTPLSSPRERSTVMQWRFPSRRIARASSSDAASSAWGPGLRGDLADQPAVNGVVVDDGQGRRERRSRSSTD
jgi:hypothetical protein